MYIYGISARLETVFTTIPYDKTAADEELIRGWFGGEGDVIYSGQMNIDL